MIGECCVCDAETQVVIVRGSPYCARCAPRQPNPAEIARFERYADYDQMDDYPLLYGPYADDATERDADD
jgi:hypothetical protein